MQERSVRLIAVFAVLAMIVTPLAVMSYESDDSDAESIDYTKYYYDQLDVAGKWIYDAVVDADGTTRTFSKHFYTNYGTGSENLHLDKFTKDYVLNKVKDDINKGSRALSIEKPMSTYWLSLSHETEIKTNGSDSNVTSVDVTVKFEDADYTTYGTKSAADAQLGTNISTISSSLDKTSRTTAITGIHDKLCDILVYDKGDETKSCEVRSVYTALAGTGHVVCEGYAKAFKALCDYNSIPCLIITGDAGTDGTYSAHMWNYVMLENECWYLVDVTWDDQSVVRTEYLLAGLDSVGFNDTKVKTSHDPTRGEISVVTGYGFTVPSLSFIAASDPSYVVTFISDGKEFNKIATPKDQKMTHISETPTKGGQEFLRWCSDKECTTPWDWNNAIVSSNMTLYAQFTADPIKITLINGDSEGYINVIKGTSTKLTELVNPVDANKTFIGWNTAKNGSGVYYSSNDSVSLNDGITLYAVWDEPSNDPVMNTINQINEFLAGESVIKGVSNTVLAIAVCSGVLLLIGFFLIRIKK